MNWRVSSLITSKAWRSPGTVLPGGPSFAWWMKQLWLAVILVLCTSINVDAVVTWIFRGVHFIHLKGSTSDEFACFVLVKMMLFIKSVAPRIYALTRNIPFFDTLYLTLVLTSIMFPFFYILWLFDIKQEIV